MMPAKHRPGDSHSDELTGPDDHFLISSMLASDQGALQALINRYDRLVRYTIFHASKPYCRQDPQWLEVIASSTWLGFTQSMQRDPNSPPGNLSAYLVKIARNQTLTALRKQQSTHKTQQLSENIESLYNTDTLETSGDLLLKLEELQTLRNCLSALDDDQQKLASQLDAITRRRWKEAADALGMQESTLRSRWTRLLELLRRCMEGKTGKSSRRGSRRVTNKTSDNLMVRKPGSDKG